MQWTFESGERRDRFVTAVFIYHNILPGQVAWKPSKVLRVETPLLGVRVWSCSTPVRVVSTIPPLNDC